MVGRVTPCAPQTGTGAPNGAHGVTRPTCRVEDGSKLFCRRTRGVSIFRSVRLEGISTRARARGGFGTECLGSSALFSLLSKYTRSGPTSGSGQATTVSAAAMRKSMRAEVECRLFMVSFGAVHSRGAADNG